MKALLTIAVLASCHMGDFALEPNLEFSTGDQDATSSDAFGNRTGSADADGYGVALGFRLRSIKRNVVMQEVNRPTPTIQGPEPVEVVPEQREPVEAEERPEPGSFGYWIELIGALLVIVTGGGYAVHRRKKKATKE